MAAFIYVKMQLKSRITHQKSKEIKKAFQISIGDKFHKPNSNIIINFIKVAHKPSRY